jgi:hypothetical protein
MEEVMGGSIGNLFEQVIERPLKKIGRETKETITGTSKEDYRMVEQPQVTAEVTPEVVPDEEETLLARGTRGTKRTKRPGQAGTILEGYGALERPKGKRAVV